MLFYTHIERKKNWMSIVGWLQEMRFSHINQFNDATRSHPHNIIDLKSGHNHLD